MEKKKKLGLVPKLIIGIILGILIGSFCPELVCRIVVTASGLFSTFLKFVIPMMILAYVTMGIADLSQGAGKLLAITAGLSYGSTLIAGSCAFLVAITLFPSFMDASALERIAATAGNSVASLFSISVTPILDTLAAVLLACVLFGGAVYFAGMLLLRGIGKQDLLALPNGQKIAKTLEKQGWI